MTYRRSLLLTLIAALFALPQVASAREPGPTWESETAGLPVSTMEGKWMESDDGRRVELVFTGGHLIQAGTAFRATWLTPFTTKGEAASFEHSHELENWNDLGKDIKITQSFRFREKGGRWFRWIRSRNTLEPGRNFLSGGSIFGGGGKRQVQFEWHWTGVIEAPTYLRGSASFEIN